MHFSVGMAADDTRELVGTPGYCPDTSWPAPRTSIEDTERSDRLHRELLDRRVTPQGSVSDVVTRMDVSGMTESEIQRAARQMMVHDEITVDESIAMAARAYDDPGAYVGLTVRTDGSIMRAVRAVRDSRTVNAPPPGEEVECPGCGAQVLGESGPPRGVCPRCGSRFAKAGQPGRPRASRVNGLRAELEAAMKQLGGEVFGEGLGVPAARERVWAARDLLAVEIGVAEVQEIVNRTSDRDIAGRYPRSTALDYPPADVGTLPAPRESSDLLPKAARAVAYVVAFPVALVMALFYWAKVVMFPAKPLVPVNTTPCGSLCRYADLRDGAWRCDADVGGPAHGSRAQFTDPKDPNNCTMFERKN